MFGKFFIGWRDETRTAKKLKLMVTAFFKICIQRLRLTPQACMAFFNVSTIVHTVVLFLLLLFEVPFKSFATS